MWAMQENMLTLPPLDKIPATNPSKAVEMEAETKPRWRLWLRQMRQALERAEIHITENFRVPPGGG